MIGKVRGNGKEVREACVGECEGMGKVGSVFGLRWGRERKRRKCDKWLNIRGWEVGEEKYCAGLLRGWLGGASGLEQGSLSGNMGLKNG